MQTNCDKSRECYLDYVKKYESYKSHDLSESDTRSKIIDSILINVLGWNEEDIVREGHVDSGYYDYKLSISGITLVVEAKRSYKDLILPIRHTSVTLNTIYRENQDVVDQIRSYIIDVGCQYGLITNGHQFILARFVNIDGTSWKNNKCLIFDGFEDLESRFVEFWNSLSKESITYRGRNAFDWGSSVSFTKTILSSLKDSDNEITRNDLSSKLTPLINKVFGEIFSHDKEDDDIQFIKECYIENKEVVKNKAELNGLFSDEPPKLNNVIKARNHSSISGQIKSEMSEEVIQLNAITPRPVIIIGTKGAGKTTFLNFLFSSSEKDVIANKPHVFVNLIKYHSGEAINKQQVAKFIIDQVNDSYPELDIHSLKVLKRIYIKEINSNDKGIWSYDKANDLNKYNQKLSDFLQDKVSNSVSHLEHLCLYFVREIHKRLIVIFDNADQLSDSIQEDAFLYACSLNTKAKCGVIISLREGYYYQWRNKPPFNAFESNVYHIAAPNYGEVLQKRINYTISLINNRDSQKITGRVDDKSVTLESKQILSFFIGVRDSLFGEIDSPVLDLLRYLSFPNIREGLRLFKSFLTSGYTDVSKYVLRVLNNADNHKITIPLHEFAQAIALENKLYYNHSASNIHNIIYPMDNRSDYFIKYYLLKRLEHEYNHQGVISSDVSYEEIVNEFLSYGYPLDVISKEIAKLLEYGLIDSSKKISDIKWHNIDIKDLNICITSKGWYYLSTMVNSFYYWDLIIQDTPIFKEPDYNIIRGLFPLRDSENKRPLDMRLNCVKAFLDYIKNSEQDISAAMIMKYGSFVRNVLGAGLKTGLERIEKKIVYQQ